MLSELLLRAALACRTRDRGAAVLRPCKGPGHIARWASLAKMPFITADSQPPHISDPIYRSVPGKRRSSAALCWGAKRRATRPGCRAPCPWPRRRSAWRRWASRRRSPARPASSSTAWLARGVPSLRGRGASDYACRSRTGAPPASSPLTRMCPGACRREKWADFAVDFVLGALAYKALGGRFRTMLPSDVRYPGAFAKESIPANGKAYANEVQR